MFDVQVRGEGEDDLVLLYGTPVPAESLEPIGEGFADDYRVLIPETVSVGMTPADALPKLEETLSDQGVENPVVLGHSLGAYRALQLALSDEFDVEKIALIGPLARLPDERHAQYEALVEQLEAGEVDLAEVATEMWFRPEYVDDNPEIPDRVRQWFDEMGDEALKEALLNEMPRQDLRPRLAEIDVPVCTIVGADDAGTPVEWSEEIADLLDDSRLHVIQNSGHFPHFERPDVTFRTLRGFFGE